MILLGIAIVLALVTTTLVLKVLSGHGSGAKGGPTTVIVAAQAIPQGTQITAEDVTTAQIASSDVQTGALTSPSMVVGQYALTSWIAGQQIVPGMAGTPQSVAFALSIPKGKRAFTIADSTFTGVDHLITVGDYVDVMETYKSGEVKTLLQDLLVLYVDQMQAAALPGSSGTGGSGNDTITLAVTQQQAQQLLYLMNQNSPLTMTLRNPHDQTTVPLTPQTHMP